MKTIILVLVAVLALLACVPVVFAEGNQTPATEHMLIAPPTNETAELDESDVSGFKPLIQELRVAFESKPERKIQLELELARLRLIQAKIAAKHNNTLAVERAISAHNRIMERVRAEIATISNKGGNITGLERAIQVHEMRIAKLGAILSSENLTAEQKAKIESKIEHVENVTWKLKTLEEKIQNKTIKNETREQKPSCSANKTNESKTDKIAAAPTGCGCGRK